MFDAWIYDNPTWLWGSILVAAVVSVSCIGLLAFNHVVRPEHKAASSDACAAIFSVTGTVYAVLIAFVAIAAWEAFGAGDRSVQAEASHVTNIYRDVAGLDSKDADSVRRLLRAYASHVATEEWAAQMAGTPIDHGPGRRILERLYLATVDLDHGGRASSLVQNEVLRELNELYKERRARHIASSPDSGIPAVVWFIISVGTALTIFASYLLAAASVRLHLLLVAIASSSIALVIVMVLALDQPFRGELCISKAPFELALDSMRPPGEPVRK